jgi:hypothetical protein
MEEMQHGQNKNRDSGICTRDPEILVENVPKKVWGYPSGYFQNRYGRPESWIQVGQNLSISALAQNVSIKSAATRNDGHSG